MSPEGLLIDVLEKAFIINTKPYSDKELAEILEIRCQDENVMLTEAAKTYWIKVTKEYSLRFSIHQIKTANLIA